MANTVQTNFVASGVEKYVSSLAAGEDAFTKLSESAKSSNLSGDFNKAATEINAALGGVKVGVDDLIKSTDSLKPTFGGVYVEESRKINDAFAESGQSAKQLQSTAEASFSRVTSRVDAGRESLKDIGKYYAETSKGLNAPISDGKNLSPLAQATSKLHTELTRLQTDINGLNGALSKTTNKSVIKIINEDLEIAETRFNKINVISDRLAQKATPVAPVNNPVEPASPKTTGFGRLRGFGAIFREVGLGINETEINAGLAAIELLNKELATTAAVTTTASTAKSAFTAAATASTSATIAEGAATVATTAAVEAETVAFAGLTLASLGIFAGVAAAGFAVYKITKSIREESERQLHVQELIVGATNRQILSQKQGLIDLQKAREEAAGNREFNLKLSSSSVEELARQRVDLEKLRDLTPVTLPILENGKVVQKANEDFTKISQQLLANDAQTAAKRLSNQKESNDAFSSANERFKKSQSDDLQFEAKRIERERQAFEKREASIKAATGKAEELTKRYRETFDNLFVSVSKDNPFANLFSESDRALNKLRENLRGTTPELIALRAAAERLQKKADGDKLFSTRLNNDFDAFDLRQRATELRDFKPPKIDDTSKFFSDFIADGLKQAIAANGGSATRFNRLANGGFSQSNIENEFTTNFSRVSNKDGSFGGFSQSQRSFADLTQKEKFDFLNKDNVGLQNRLSSAFDLAGNRNALDDTQKSEIDRKILSLSSGVNPSQLTDGQRDVVATAAENEAKRKENLENEGLKLQRAQSELQMKINENLAGLLKIAQTDGLKGVEQTLRIINESDAEVDFLPTRPQ